MFPKIITSILVIFLSITSRATTWTSISAGSWTNSAIWSCGGCGIAPPSDLSSHSVIINHAVTNGGNITDGWSGTSSMTINSSGGSLAATSFSISNQGQLTVTGGGNMNLTGALTVNGGWSGASSISANVNAASFTYSNGLNFSMTGNLTTTGNIIHSGGQSFNLTGNLSTSGGSITHSGGNNFVVSGNISAPSSSLTQSGGANFSVGGNLSTSGTIAKSNGNNFTVGGNMTSSSGGLTLSGGGGAISVSGNTSLSGAYSYSGSSATVQFGGTFSASSLTANGGDVTTFNGAVTTPGAVTMISGGKMVFNSSLSASAVVMNAGGGASLTLNGSTNISGNLNLDLGATVKGNGSLAYGSFTMNGGSQVLGGNSCSFTSAASLPSSPLNLASCTLPIVLKAFNVEYLGNDFDFKWATFQEIDNDYFTLEYSFDSKNFVGFTKIEGAGTSYQTLEYQYEDSKLSFERDVDVVYFRLKQTDFDGTYAYSHVVPIMLSNKYKLSSSHFYPNPATENLTLRMEEWDRYKEGLVLDFINASGKVYSKSISINSTETKIDLTDLPKGIYMISSGGLLDTVKLFVN